MNPPTEASTTDMTLLDDRQDPAAGPFDGRNRAPRAVTSTEVRGRSKHSSVSWKAPGVAEVEDPDVRRDTFLPAQCRDADSGLGQLVTQPTPKE